MRRAIGSFTCCFLPCCRRESSRIDDGPVKPHKKVKDHFDLVVIVRGGGDDIGLSCYNDYRLARAIAEFPLPVLTGIGHSTNETVCEMISYSNAITPTKLAEWLLQKFHDFREP
jgi:exodeoxyribonuclease VII large subunit